MEIIATHLGADFDAFASAVLARKLHPAARIFFPGSKEESVRRMLDGPIGEGFEVPEVRAKEIDPARIERLILCDVVQRGRLGVVTAWLDEHPGIEVIAYDHHDPTDDDVPATGGVIDPEAGSTATVLSEIFERRGIAVSPDEATLLLLGLYEDTGSLTYANTGARELRAAAWLVERGGDLAAVRRYAVQRLDPGRLDILHRMTDALSLRRIRGHRVGVLALELGDFVDELAPLVNRCLEIFELPLLFAVFGEGDRVTLIARGDVPGVHLGHLMEGFAGGGGHPTAASARLKGATPLETRERLLGFLEKELPPAVRAADLMVTGFHTLDAGATVGAAKATLVERRINAAPVLGPDRKVLGVVTRQTLDGALQHGLGDRLVETVTDRDVEWVGPEAPVEEVGEKFLRRHPRLILVGESDGGLERGENGKTGKRKLVGLITRMQLLRHLHGSLRAAGTGVEKRMAHLPEERAPVGGLLRERLAPALAGQVEAIVAVSRRLRVPVYLVGGIVRDLLLARENRDLDLVVEGDGPHLARELAETLGGRVRVHEAFMTAVVVDPEERHIDVASARSEFYRAPAALPEVQMSPLRQDLYRRDFTINTLAIRLGPEPSPELVDYFGGRRDLENGLLRVLHSLSFIDDPTRVLRAIRLSLRLGFEISPETLHLVEVALAEGVFDHLSGSRLREELILLLDDPALAARGLERLEALGVLRVVHSDLRLEAADRDRLRRAVAAWDWYSVEGLAAPRAALWRLMLVALAQQEPGPKGGFGPRQVEEIADRLMLSGEDRDLLVGSRRRLAAAREVLVRPEAKPHEISDAMAALSGEEALMLVGSEEESVRTWARRELIELRPLVLTVRGRDLVERGVPPGPWMGEALDAVRRARLDGEIGADEELATALDRVTHLVGLPGVALAILLLLLLIASSPVRAQDRVRELTLDPESEQDRSAAEILRAVPGDLRSTVVLRYDCASEVGRREVTLFANGTVRLWDGPPEDQEMVLAELDPDVLDGFLLRLDREDLSEEPDSYPGVDGDWVERCELDLPLREGRGPSHFEINRYTQLSLGLSRLVRVAEEVGDIADEHRGAGLDADYRPRRGDVLERPDGVRFRVVDFTSDGKGLELEGVDIPLTLYLAPDALPEVFARVVERRPDFGGPDPYPDGDPDGPP